jgi:hypothetical protein
MDRVRKPNVSESYTPSSESYSNYLLMKFIFISYLNFVGKEVFEKTFEFLGSGCINLHST